MMPGRLEKPAYVPVLQRNEVERAELEETLIAKLTGLFMTDITERYALLIRCGFTLKNAGLLRLTSSPVVSAIETVRAGIDAGQPNEQIIVEAILSEPMPKGIPEPQSKVEAPIPG